jgi:cation diffusion facilitator family transporter
MMAHSALTPEQRNREQSVMFAILLDCCTGALYLAVGILGGSLTIIAEAIRGFLLLAIEAYGLHVLRKIHRGQVADYEFGAGKLEQMCNLVIAISMIGGALWIANRAVRLVIQGHADAAPLGLALAAAFGAVNVFANYAAWFRVRQAARAGGSVIMQAQLNARVAKLVASFVVQFALTVAALAHDPIVAAWADGIGALFVSGFIMVMAVRMLREGLPDLLDRSVDEATRLSVLQVLAHHFHAYDSFERVRSRRSGGTVFVELALGFDGRLPLAEVHERASAIKAHIAREIEGADVAILLSPHSEGQ